MAAEKIELEITTPERLVLLETVDEVVLPGSQGYLGVLPGHAPLLTGLSAGELAYRVGDRYSYLAVSTGFAEILRDKVSILADTCERAEEIDLARAERAQERATKVISDRASERKFRKAGVKLKKATARIKVRQRHQ